MTSDVGVPPDPDWPPSRQESWKEEHEREAHANTHRIEEQSEAAGTATGRRRWRVWGRRLST